VQRVLAAATATEIREISGVPLSQLDPAIVMNPDAMVDAALAGLDRGETVTLPSVEDTHLRAEHPAAALKLLIASPTGSPASCCLKTLPSTNDHPPS
jgi:short-subunit dehydrogenase